MGAGWVPKKYSRKLKIPLLIKKLLKIVRFSYFFSILHNFTSYLFTAIMHNKHRQNVVKTDDQFDNDKLKCL